MSESEIINDHLCAFSVMADPAYTHCVVLGVHVMRKHSHVVAIGVLGDG